MRGQYHDQYQYQWVNTMTDEALYRWVTSRLSAPILLTVWNVHAFVVIEGESEQYDRKYNTFMFPQIMA